MKKLVSKVAALSSAALMAIALAPALPASASLASFESRVNVTASTLQVSASSATFTVTVTDTDGKLIGPSVSILSGELKVVRVVNLVCPTPLSSSKVGHNSGCGDFPVFQSGAPTISGDSRQMTLTYVENSPSWFTRHSLAASQPVYFGVVIADSSGDFVRVVDLGSSKTEASGAPSPETDPGVSFAGFLISGASGRVVDAEIAGTLRFTGKRMNQVSSATIGGIAVTVTSATRSALELGFDSLPEGKHDVVLTSKSGAKTTLRGFVTVN